MFSRDEVLREGAVGAPPTGHVAGKSSGNQRESARRIYFASGAWREEVKGRLTRLEAEARWLHQSRQPSADQLALMRSQVCQPLADLNVVLRTSPRWNVLSKLRLWFLGSEIEECWRLLRQAEEGLLIVDDRGVRSHAESALVVGNAVLGNADPKVQNLARELEDTGTPSAEMALQRAAFDVLSHAHEVSDGRHRQMRGFRNQLFGLSGVLLILAAALVLFQRFVMDAPLIPPPAAETWRPEPTTTLILVMFSGCIGALFSAVPSLAQIPEADHPFDLARAQAILKCVIGMWSAVVGILVVEAAIAGATAQADSSTLAGLFIVAALFGAGQEAITRFADHKATTIRSSVQSP